MVGSRVRVKVVKNKVAPPFKKSEFDIMYGEGISKTGEIIDLGVKAEIVDKAGSWFSYDGQRIGQGRENTKNFLKDNPSIARSIERSIRENAGLIVDQMLLEPDNEEEEETIDPETGEILSAAEDVTEEPTAKKAVGKGVR